MYGIANVAHARLRAAPRLVSVPAGPASRPGRLKAAPLLFVAAGLAMAAGAGKPSVAVELAPGEIVTLYYQVDDLKNAPRSAKAKALLWRVSSN